MDAVLLGAEINELEPNLLIGCAMFAPLKLSWEYC